MSRDFVCVSFKIYHCGGFCFLVVYFLMLLFETQIASSAIIYSMHHQKKSDSSHRSKTPVYFNQTGCDLYSGSWVKDDSLPVYKSSNCQMVDAQFDCQREGRPDSEYQRFQWKPNDCELPRFDGGLFLTRMRGKTLMFVGDSLGKNQWESLICMVLADVPYTQTQVIRRDPLLTFGFLDYGVTLLFYKAPYLVDIDAGQGKRILELDDISSNAEAWKGADVLVFNSGHWWIHAGRLQGWDYMESDGSLYREMDRLAAYEKGLRTWAKYVDNNIDRTKVTVIFQAISPTHYDPNEWSATPATKNCYRETVPVSGGLYSGAYPDQMNIVNAVLRDMRSPPYLLDITTLSQLRKDAHPSIYSGDIPQGQRGDPFRYSDCSHWCLPGLPDTWNQLLYTALFF
ncbi:hypothetical protein C5167_047266 [Papaver somniferum]|uniref:Uncharacterized protein n=1 Tax=Papaver somniferum TaxID=3469 RepID=A0A4Y7LIN9_PAPSO|nr:protein PMR5-like [Papaver somniferum]RZC84480.1 hypothetical protein C5167_047266 [Papaver somniferum]